MLRSESGKARYSTVSGDLTAKIFLLAVFKMG